MRLEVIEDKVEDLVLLRYEDGTAFRFTREGAFDLYIRLKRIFGGESGDLSASFNPLVGLPIKKKNKKVLFDMF